MAPVTDFAVKEKYTYLNGFGQYHQSEALPGANPIANNSPQKPPYGLRTERISGSSFTAPRDQNLQTWMYRVSSSLGHGNFQPVGDEPVIPKNLNPNAYFWPSFDLDDNLDWRQQKLLAQNGDPGTKTGVAIWLFAITKDMPDKTVFSSLDGDILIVPQSGSLDIQTELGKLLVRQNEIAVIPRGVRYRVTLPAGPARGYICELFQGHFKLPDLGIIGSTGSANIRDFQIPVAFFDGELQGDIVKVHNSEWTLFSRLGGRLWSCTQDHTPFDVVSWHGTNYPYKFDLARFEVLGNVSFGEHDPSLYVVLTAPTYIEPGAAVVEFAVIPPRWQVAEDTLWIPYFHRNTCAELFGPIVNAQDPEHPFNSTGIQFLPFGMGLNNSNTTHGANESDFAAATKDELKPTKVMNDGISIALFETEKPLHITDWAEEAAHGHLKREPKSKI